MVDHEGPEPTFWTLQFDDHQHIAEAQVMQITGFTRARIRRLDRAGQIISVVTNRGAVYYLAGQFSEGGPLPNLQRVIACLRLTMTDPEIDTWLVTPMRMTVGRPTSPLHEMVRGVPARALTAARSEAWNKLLDLR